MRSNIKVTLEFQSLACFIKLIVLTRLKKNNGSIDTH